MNETEHIFNRVFIGISGTFASISLPDLASAVAGIATAIYMISATYKNLKKTKNDEPKSD